MLISPEYAKLNSDLHKTKPSYGTNGAKRIAAIKEIAKEYEIETILDYGCGKGMLKKAAKDLPFQITNYDPAFPQWAALPNNVYDLVLVGDVLEHVEPGLIDNVLEHIYSCTGKIAYLTVATIPAKKFLADGRNAHLIVEPYSWWEEKINRLFDVIKHHKNDRYEGEVIVWATRKDRRYVLRRS